MRRALTLSTALAAVALAATLHITPASAAAYDQTVFRAQVALNQKGFDAGTPDGKMGPHTRAAIEAFQRANGMNPSGVLNRRLLAELEGGAAPRATAAPATERRHGPRLSQSELIRQTQHELNRHGYHLSFEGGRLNGETSDAIRDYQSRHGLEPTGMPSQQLLAALRRDDSRAGGDIRWNGPRADNAVAPPYQTGYGAPPPPVQVTPPQPVQCADFLHQSRPGGSDYQGPPVAGCTN